MPIPADEFLIKIYYKNYYKKGEFIMKKTALVLLVILAVFTLVSCSLESKIQGTWEETNNLLGVDIKTEYTFNDDGTGKIKVAGELAVDMTYTVDGDTLTITTDMVITKSTETYKASIDGDTLTLVGENGLETTLTRVK